MSTSKTLRHTLVVRDPDGAATALLAGEDVPDWATDLVRADDYGTPEEPESEGAEPEKPAKKAARKRA